MIQIDMFEVQLGAALLLSFETSGGTVRVLADAGVKASGYKPEHVLNKLRPLLAGGSGRLDLVIGTHYDADHLNGLVPIIADQNIEIGEAWMPPVADDSEQFAVNTNVGKGELLAQRFSGEGGDDVLRRYLDFKKQEIDTLLKFESFVEPLESTKRYLDQIVAENLEKDELLIFFHQQLTDTPNDGWDHGIEPDVELDQLLERFRDRLRHDYYPYWLRIRDETKYLESLADTYRSEVPVITKAQARSLASLRRNSAKDAINANALHAVVRELDKRNIPIRCEVIGNGSPRNYRWDANKRRFILAKSVGADLTFTLLGPSESLVRKHRDRLPVIESSKLALAFRGELRSITPSNQLSYIGCFHFAEQSILVSGDAGCVDFALNRKKYYPELLAAMKSLNVVQVAHHGGNNGHFYRVLKQAGYPNETEQSFLLLSHSYHDKTRPSEVFREFILTTIDNGDDVALLFTSEPRRERVEDFLQMINPCVGEKADVGDVRLLFENGRWIVAQHAVAVA